ncbi:hypothetical protein DC429_03395 [Arthrobacter sp. TPD3018]|nr:hypothetical protein DC425_03390 [Sphingomonas sp. TPD3009]PVE60980.1 hypothetical protein DC429_03395 [Arthrobacter sp. TPD3018]PVE87659.1 hypothetical protein DC431_03390 [Sphingomonas melonis]
MGEAEEARSDDQGAEAVGACPRPPSFPRRRESRTANGAALSRRSARLDSRLRGNDVGYETGPPYGSRNVPSITVTHAPPSTTRSPSSAQDSSPPRLLA